MRDLKELAKLNWMDYFILKALVSTEDKRLSSRELKEKIISYCRAYGVDSASRIFLHQRIEKLILFGLVEKTKSSENIYILRTETQQSTTLLCAGFFGLLDGGISNGPNAK